MDPLPGKAHLHPAERLTSPASGPATTTPAACTRRPANEVIRGAISLELQHHQGRARPAQPGRRSTASARSPARASGSGAPARCRATPSGATSTCAGCSTSSRSRSSAAPTGSCSSRTTRSCGTRSSARSRCSCAASGATARCSARTPAEAFFVKCDEENNPPENRDAGILTVEIGIAPVKPAEFVVFRITQFTGGAGLESEGRRAVRSRRSGLEAEAQPCQRVDPLAGKPVRHHHRRRRDRLVLGASGHHDRGRRRSSYLESTDEGMLVIAKLPGRPQDPRRSRSSVAEHDRGAVGLAQAAHGRQDHRGPQELLRSS